MDYITQEAAKNNDFIWKPTLKQEKFLSIPLTVKEGFYAGAVNAGKTDVLLMYPIVRGWINHPKFKGLFLRRTMPELRNEVIPRSRDYFRPFGGRFNESNGIWTFPSGALFFFGHCENEKDVHNYDSMQPNYAAFDELTSFTEWMYTYITIERVRRNKNLPELPQIVRSGSNPGNTGHRWVYERFIKPHPEGHWILKARGGLKRIFIPATIDDNPHADPQYKAELDALPEAERKAKKYGDWTAFEGSVFSEFRDKKHLDEPDNALHVISEFEVPMFWPRLVSIDWGFRAMTWVGYFAVSPNKRIYLYREQSFIEEKIEDWAPKVKVNLDRENIDNLVICHSAAQNRGQPQTILEQVSDALNRSLDLGSKDRIGALSAMREYLRWKTAFVPQTEIEPYNQEFAEWLLRNKSEDFYKSYIDQYIPREPPKNLPKLQIFESCKLVVQSIKDCQYDKKKRDDKPAEDVAEFPGDDPYDGLKQALVRLDIFFDEASDKNSELEKRQAIEDKLKQNQDMTMYYRNSKKLEQEELTPAVARFHRGRRNVH